MKGIIDRFEGEFAVVETDKGFVNVPRAKLPAEAKEGAVIDLDSFSVDNKAEAERTEKIRGMMDKLFGN